MQENDLLARRRTRNWETRLLEMLRDRLLERVRGAVSQDDLSRYAAEIAGHTQDPYSIVDTILSGLGRNER